MVDGINSTCLVLSALFVDLEADFHARVPVVICKDKKRCKPLSCSDTGYLSFH